MTASDIPNTCLNKSEQGDACGSCTECDRMHQLLFPSLPAQYQEFAACEAGALVKAIDEMIADMSYPPEILALAESVERTALVEAYYNEVYTMVLNDICPHPAAEKL